MKKSSIFWFIVISVFFIGTQVNAANFMRADGLLKICSPNASATDKIECYGYMQGSFDMLMELIDSSVNLECYEKNLRGVTADQLSKIMVKFLSENPKYLNYTSSSIIPVVVLADFPVPKECYKEK